jgi:hypothetical protein
LLQDADEKGKAGRQEETGHAYGRQADERHVRFPAPRTDPWG